MIRRVFRVLPESIGYEDDAEGPPEAYEIGAEPDLITSEIDEFAKTDEKPWLFARVDEHAPVLDIDFPAAVIPSSTPGKFHLYLDTRVPHDKYMALLDALADAGIIEEGYAGASKARGYTAVRLPWVQKPSKEEADE